MLQDMAVLTGGQVLSEEAGMKLESMTLEQLGKARRVVADKDTTTIIGGAGARAAIDAHQADPARDGEGHQHLRQGEAAGAARQAGRRRRGDPRRSAVGSGDQGQARGTGRCDQLHQSRGGRRHRAGWRPGAAAPCAGGGDEEAQASGDERTGVQILKRALEAPARQIAENSAVDGGVVVAKMLEGSGNFGFDAARNQYVDLVETGIIDPTKVVRVGLENAVSVASVLLLTEATMTEIEEQKSERGHPGEMEMYRARNGVLRRLQRRRRRLVRAAPVADPASAGSIVFTGIKRDIECCRQSRPGLMTRSPCSTSRSAQQRGASAAARSRGRRHVVRPSLARAHPVHDGFAPHIDTDPETCTSLLVDRHLKGRFRLWAIAAAYGDNLAASAERLADAVPLSPPQRAQLRMLGEAVNYNAYGDSEADVRIHRRRCTAGSLTTTTRSRPSRMHRSCVNSTHCAALTRPRAQSTAAQGRAQRRDRCPTHPGAVASRGRSPTSSRCAIRSAHAVLKELANGGYAVSIRAPSPPSGAVTWRASSAAVAASAPRASTAARPRPAALIARRRRCAGSSRAQRRPKRRR